MITKKKALNGVIPVTTTKAVYLDGTNKTLQEAIDNGELGGSGSNLVFRKVQEGEIFEVTNPVAKVYGNIVVSTTSISLNKSATQTFTVKLDKAPTANQVITIGVNNGNATVNKTTLTFTPQNYNTTQSVTINGVNVGSSVITLSSPNVTSKTINVTVNQVQTNVYGNIVVSKTSMEMVEMQSDGFTVKLDKAPTNNQVVTLSVNNSDVSLGKTSLTFTPQNYNTPQEVRVSIDADSDTVDDTCTITLSSPNVPNKTISLTIDDLHKVDSTINDSNLIVSTSSISVAKGQSKTITVKLNKRPSKNIYVIAGITEEDSCATVSSNSAVVSADGEILLKFTPSNYNVEQQVNIIGVKVGNTQICAMLSYAMEYKLINVTVTENSSSNEEFGEIELSADTMVLVEGTEKWIGVRLTKQPTNEQVFTVTPSNDKITCRNEIKFTPENATEWQDFFIGARLDDDSDNESGTVAFSNPNVPSKIIPITIKDSDNLPRVIFDVEELHLKVGEEKIVNASLSAEPEQDVYLYPGCSPAYVAQVIEPGFLGINKGEYNLQKAIKVRGKAIGETRLGFEANNDCIISQIPIIVS